MTDLVDGFGRHFDVSKIDWMHTGPSTNQMWILSCRHGTTRSFENGEGGSEGEILSRLITEHKDNVNASDLSYRGRWICGCEPHKGTA